MKRKIRKSNRKSKHSLQIKNYDLKRYLTHFITQNLKASILQRSQITKIKAHGGTNINILPALNKRILNQISFISFIISARTVFAIIQEITTGI